MKKLVFAVVDCHGNKTEVEINAELNPVLMTHGDTRCIYLKETDVHAVQVPISWGIMYLGIER